MDHHVIQREDSDKCTTVNHGKSSGVGLVHVVEYARQFIVGVHDERVGGHHVCGGDHCEVSLRLEEVDVSLSGEQLDGEIPICDDTDRFLVLDDDDTLRRSD